VAEALKVFEVGFADFAEEQTFQAGHPLTVVGAHLGEEPVGLAATASAAVATAVGRRADRKGEPAALAASCLGWRMMPAWEKLRSWDLGTTLLQSKAKNSFNLSCEAGGRDGMSWEG